MKSKSVKIPVYRFATVLGYSFSTENEAKSDSVLIADAYNEIFQYLKRAGEASQASTKLIRANTPHYLDCAMAIIKALRNPGSIVSMMNVERFCDFDSDRE